MNVGLNDGKANALAFNTDVWSGVTTAGAALTT